MKIGRISWIIQAVPASSQGSLKVEVGGSQESVSVDMRMTPLNIAGFEDGSGAQEAKSADNL